MNSMSMNSNGAGKGPVYCPICTRTVEAHIVIKRKRPVVKPGQRCPHCAASLDAGFALQYDRAA